MACDLRALRVLLVDDNRAMRAIVGAVLGGLGVRELRQATDGAAALAILREWPADLAIVDFLMTPMDGVGFTRQVRHGSDSLNPYLPVIMTTGYAELARVVEARDAGVTEFLVKPVTAQSIIDRLEAVIHRPRPFVQSADFFGPDRRRRQLVAYAGPRRRAGETSPGVGAARPRATAAALSL